MSRQARKRLAGFSLVILAVLSYCLSGSAFRTSPNGAATQSLTTSHLGLLFEPNVGQTGEAVRYLAHAPGANLYFTPSEVTLTFGAQPDEDMQGGERARGPGLAAPQAPTSQTTSVVRVRFLGADPARTIEHGAVAPGKVNYFIGNDPSAWHTDVPLYGDIFYKGLYAGIDLAYSGDRQGQLKGTYAIAPGANPLIISWRYDGAGTPTVDESGNLTIALSSGQDSQLVEAAPVAWQEIDGQKVSVPASYSIRADGSIGFKVGSYDSARPLVIDPTLTYSTYLGGTGSDGAYALAVDPSRNMYIVGVTGSDDYPVHDPIQPNHTKSADVIITKMNASGDALVYSTYLGGNDVDWARGIKVDSDGNAVVTGQTTSTDFPTVNPKQPSNGGWIDAFVLKVNPEGSALVFSTYLGGSTMDQGSGVDVDQAGNIYVCGSTISANFPTFNAIQGTMSGAGDAFITKYTSDGQSYVYSTFLGGSVQFDGEDAYGIAADSTGNAYATGVTSSQDFPTFNAFFPTYQGGESDAFITKLNPDGSAFVFSTYFGGGHTIGGSGADTGFAITLDSENNIYVTGDTDSDDFPVVNPIQPTLVGFYDVFVSKMNAAGTALIYSTYVGGHGPGNERGQGIAVNAAGEVAVVGIVDSADFPLVNPIQPTYGGALDAFALKMTPAGNPASFITYLGGSGSDYGQGAAIDDDGAVYASGFTASTNFPTANPFQDHNAAPFDVFISKISDPAGGTPTPGPSSTSTSTSTSTPSAIPTSTSTSTATRTPSALNTATGTAPAATNTPTTAPTSTSIPTSTPTSTSTSAATSTGTVPAIATATSTSVSTATATTVPTGTSTATPAACTIPFSDVPVGSTFYTFIKCLACMGILNGYPDGTFRPNNNVTRGQIAKIVSNAAGFSEAGGPQQFEDVVPGSTFYDFVWRLASREIISGYACGGQGEPCGDGNLPYFRPNGNATRGQISKIVSEAAGPTDPPGSQQFEDVDPGSTFYDFIYRLALRGIMNGYPCGGPGEPCGVGNLPYFRPSNDATRGQLSKIVSNTFLPGCTPQRR